MKIKEFQHQPVQPDTYEASMALNQLMRIGKHAIKLHNMIDDAAEMESWVAKKIDLAGDYVKKVYNYTEGEKAGLYDDGGMSEMKKMPKGTGTMYGVKEDAGDMDLIGDGAENLGLDANKFDYYYDTSGAGYGEVRTKSGKAILQFEYDRDGDAEVSTMDNKTIANIKQGEQLPNNVTAKLNMIKEDAGDQEKMQGLLQWFKNKYDTYRKDFIDDQIENGIRGSQLEQAVENNDELVELENIIDALKSGSMKDAIEEINRAKYEFSGIPGDGDDFMQVIEKLGIPKDTFYFTKDESLEARLEAKLSEDAGEGHMSKSTLYHTAKYAIELMQMIKKGDDLEGWVQSKLNKAADYLQGVYNYEEYQKLNPYREELDSSLMQKHAQVIQKNIDEILAKETKLDDIDTKPGMMRILAKRVNEVEKEMAKETRKHNEGKMSDIDLDMKSMSDEDFKKK